MITMRLNALTGMGFTQRILDPAIIHHINKAYPHIEKWVISHAPHC